MKQNKTFLIIGIVVLLLGLALVPSINAGLRYEGYLFNWKESKPNKEVTFYRIGPYGKVTEIKTSLEIEKDQDLETLIVKKCQDLYGNDEELQDYFKSNPLLEKSEVKSEGSGFHLCLFLRLPFLNRSVFRRSIIYYRYKNEDAYTKVNLSEGWWTLENGPHLGRILGFRGYVHFSPRRLFGYTVLHGYCTQVSTGKLKE